MLRVRSVLSFVATGTICALGGYWLGFRSGGDAALSAEFAHRGVIATQYIAELNADRKSNVIGLLELDVDNGLLWGDQLLQDPMAGLYQRIWQFDGHDVRKSVQRLGAYRLANPVPPGASVASDIDAIAKRNAPK
jgi:hypothetical protein